ncbi:MAG: enoyl-CoA hydratase/isomerase family protein [Candidatus Dormibacteria bacterium]
MSDVPQGDAAPLVLVSRPAPGVARIALNRPQQRNALTEELAQALREEVRSLAATAGVRALILTGAGKTFCAGADLGALGRDRSTAEGMRQALAEYYRAFLDLRDLEVPTVAAVNGAAVGAGLNLALCCDLRVLSESARMAAPFARLGIHPGGGATWMLSRLLGPGAARELLLLGEPIGADRALALGLATRVVTADQLEVVALQWAVGLAKLSHPVVSDLRRTLRMAETGYDWDAVLDFETEAQARSLLSEDAREGWNAFKEHRQPQFHDR